jgi:hypothetical protein
VWSAHWCSSIPQKDALNAVIRVVPENDAGQRSRSNWLSETLTSMALHAVLKDVKGSDTPTHFEDFDAQDCCDCNTTCRCWRQMWRRRTRNVLRALPPGGTPQLSKIFDEDRRKSKDTMPWGIDDLTRIGVRGRGGLNPRPSHVLLLLSLALLSRTK